MQIMLDKDGDPQFVVCIQPAVVMDLYYFKDCES